MRLLPPLALAILAALALPAPAQTHQHGAPAPLAKAARPALGTSAAFAPDGSLLAVSAQGGHVLLQRSTDLGRSWGTPVVVNAQPEVISADGENRPKLAFPQDGGVLVSWTQALAKPFSGAIRLARSEDGEHFAPPITVHQDRAEITHRFESLVVTGDGRVVVAWIDKRDLEAQGGPKSGYRGAAIYAAISTDQGRSFLPERKVADHSCECCRIAATTDQDGAPLLLWRHVFAPNERDHALARLGPEGQPQAVQRATFDGWKIDACPHHGPALAVDPAGIRHSVWFNQKDGEGRVFYGRLVPTEAGLQVEGQRPVGGPSAAHADIGTASGRLAIAWKEFDGEHSRLRAWVSQDGGLSFSPLELAATRGASDQPRVLRRGNQLYAFWRTQQEGFTLYPLP